MGSHSLLFNLFINHRWSRRLILQWVGKQNLTKLTRYRMINIHRFSNRLCDCSLLDACHFTGHAYISDMDWFNFIAYKLTPGVRLRKSRKFFGSFSWNRPAVAISNRLALLATRIVMRSRFLDHLRVVLNFRIRLCLRAVVNFRALNLILVHTLLNLVRWSLILARFRWGLIHCCLIFL